MLKTISRIAIILNCQIRKVKKSRRKPLDSIQRAAYSMISRFNGFRDEWKQKIEGVLKNLT